MYVRYFPFFGVHRPLLFSLVWLHRLLAAVHDTNSDVVSCGARAYIISDKKGSVSLVNLGAIDRESERSYVKLTSVLLYFSFEGDDNV